MDIPDEDTCAEADVNSMSKSKAKANPDPGDGLQVPRGSNKTANAKSQI